MARGQPASANIKMNYNRSNRSRRLNKNKARKKKNQPPTQLWVIPHLTTTTKRDCVMFFLIWNLGSMILNPSFNNSNLFLITLECPSQVLEGFKQESMPVVPLITIRNLIIFISHVIHSVIRDIDIYIAQARCYRKLEGHPNSSLFTQISGSNVSILMLILPKPKNLNISVLGS